MPPPPPLRFRPPYDWAAASFLPPVATAAARVFHGESGHAPTGRLKTVSRLTVNDASNAEVAALAHAAWCFMWVEPNGKAPLTISAIYNPAVTNWSGTIDDEFGDSAVDLHWDIVPDCWLLFGNNLVNVKPSQPAVWRSYVDNNFRTHAWGPILWPAGGQVAAIWNYNAPLPNNGLFGLYVGFQSPHYCTADDVSLVSDADAEFHLKSVIVQMT